MINMGMQFYGLVHAQKTEIKTFIEAIKNTLHRAHEKKKKSNSIYGKVSNF